jgi:hypothetical protein
MDFEDVFKNDLKDMAGGILISDIINNERVILLGKSNIPKRIGTYESFGGKTEKQDISSLHTAIREMVEEFFNYEISTKLVNDIAYNIRISKLIIKSKELYGMSYLIDFTGLNFIFQFVLTEIPILQKYNVNNFFDYKTYISERIINGKAKEGLNEIEKIELFKLSDIKDKYITLRWFTNKIIWLMLLTKENQTENYANIK